MKTIRYKVLFKFKDSFGRHIVGLYDYGDPNNMSVGTTGEDVFEDIVAGDIWDGETHYKYVDKYWNYGPAPFHYQLPIEYMKTPKI